MARAWAQDSNIAFASDGQIFVSYWVTYVDPATQFVEGHEVSAVVLATDSIMSIRTQMAQAIINKGVEIGQVVTANEIIQPTYAKG